MARVGLARLEHLMENLKRDLALGNSALRYKEKVETLSTVGSYAAPTKTLLASDSGLTMYVDISTVSVVIELPTPAAGLHFKVVLSTASDAEGTKDCAVTTGSSAVDMGGHVSEVGGAPLDVTTGTSVIAWDTSDGAANVGDWLEFDCDGTDWYVRGSAMTASAFDIHDTYTGHTIP